MHGLARSVLLLTLIGVSGCGGEDTVAPEFPRQFTSASDSCSMGVSLNIGPEPTTLVENVFIQTVETTSEPLFPDRFCFVISTLWNLPTAEILEESVAPLSCPEMGDWSLTLTAGPGDWHFTGAGTGYVRSIEFVMDPTFDVCDPPCQCGFTTAGTIR
jgi:hypothetical protein